MSTMESYIGYALFSEYASPYTLNKFTISLRGSVENKPSFDTSTTFRPKKYKEYDSHLTCLECGQN